MTRMLTLTAALVLLASPALGQETSVRAGARITFSVEALGLRTGDRVQFVRGLSGSLREIAGRSTTPDSPDANWLTATAVRLDDLADRVEAAAGARGRTLAEIGADLRGLEEEWQALRGELLAEARVRLPGAPAIAPLVERLESDAADPPPRTLATR